MNIEYHFILFVVAARYVEVCFICHKDNDIVGQKTD
jgi:hypothetical protein